MVDCADAEGSIGPNCGEGIRVVEGSMGSCCKEGIGVVGGVVVEGSMGSG